MIKKTIIALYTLIIVCIGLATIIEKYRGTPYVSEYIYGSWWFVALWAVLTVCSVAYIMRQKLYSRLPVFMLHLSFVVILVGALTTFLLAEKGTVSLRVGKQQSSFVSSDSIMKPLPFTLMLKEFRVVNYPGTDAPLDYQSIIDVKDNETQNSVVVSMNNIGSVRGYRLFQSSYDSDSQGVTLGVYYDPWGIAVTYFGYLLLLISIVWVCMSRHNNIRTLYRKATKPLALMAFMVMGTTASAQAPETVDADIAHSLGTVSALYNNRICPANTAATDFVTKLSGKSTWNGYSADEIFFSWMIYYSSWENQKLIRIKNRGVQQLLGIDGQWASFSDFIDSYNEYKLKDAIDQSRKGGGEIEARALMDADEKYHVVEMFYKGQLLRIFPYTFKDSVGWYSPGAQVLPREIPVKESFFIKQSMDFLTESIVVGQKERALEIIAKIKLFQRDMAGEVIPSYSATHAEIFYNHLNGERWVVFLSLTLSLLLCIVIASGSSLSRRKWWNIAAAAYIILLTFYLTLLLALRWWIGGHVPVSNGYETMQFMAWALLVIVIATHRTFPMIVGFGALTASLCMLVAMLAGGSPQITQLMPVLQSPLLSVHVMVVMCAYALFALQVLLAVQALWLCRKSGNAADTERVTALSQLLLYPAVFLLAIGIFVGAVWANVSWGNYWSWDPKETWALITLMIYAAPMHGASLPLFRKPRAYHIYIIMAFLSVLVTYFGVNFLLGGMHSYA